MLSGTTLQANSTFRCVVECRLGRQELPASLIVSVILYMSHDIIVIDDQEQLRPVCAVIPNTTVLADVLLLSEGFLYSVVLAKKMSLLWDMLKREVRMYNHR